MIQKIITYAPLCEAKYVCNLAKTKLNLTNKIGIITEKFKLKSKSDYDKLVTCKRDIEPANKYFDWDAIGRMLTFKV